MNSVHTANHKYFINSSVEYVQTTHSKKKEIKKVKQTHFSIVVRFIEASVFACKHKQNVMNWYILYVNISFL